MSDSVDRDRTSPSALIGLTLHALTAFPYLLAGLFASVWTVAALWTVWTAILAVALALRQRRPRITAVLPAIALGIWLVVISAAAV